MSVKRLIVLVALHALLFAAASTGRPMLVYWLGFAMLFAVRTADVAAARRRPGGRDRPTDAFVPVIQGLTAASMAVGFPVAGWFLYWRRVAAIDPTRAMRLLDGFPVACAVLVAVMLTLFLAAPAFRRGGRPGGLDG